MFRIIPLSGNDGCGDEFDVVDRLKSFGELNCHGERAEWGKGWLKLRAVLCARGMRAETARRKHAGCRKVGVNLVLHAESVPELYK